MQKAKTCRLGTPCTPRTFKQLLACRTQHHLTLDAERIAELAELRKDRLYCFSSDNDPSQIPLPALLKICAALDAWDLLDFALDQYGRRTVSLMRTPALNLVREAMDLPIAAGRTMEVIQRATVDGHIDDQDEREIRQQTRALRREADDVDSALDNAKARTA